MQNVANHERTTAESDPLSVLKLIVEASAAYVAVTFVAGWSYLASYYRTFGLNPLELDIPIPVVAAIGLYDAVLPVLPWGVLVALLAIAAGYFTRSRETFTRLRGSQRGWVVLTLILLMVCLAAVAVLGGRRKANDDMTEDSPNLPFVAFSSKSEGAKKGDASLGQPPCLDYESFGEMSCKLLLHSKGVYYFFRPIREQAEIIDKLDLYMIPDSAVSAIHTQLGVDLAKIKK